MKYIELLDRLEAINEIEKETGTKVITFYRNPANDGGLINEASYRDFSAAIDKIGNYVPLTIIMHTMGGRIYFGWRIACCLMDRAASVTVIIPEESLSTGTLIALAANEIVMFPRAQLSPVDPQVSYENELIPAMDLLDSQNDVAKSKGKNNFEVAEEYLSTVCETKVRKEELSAVVERFLRKDKFHKGHATSILFKEVKELGLPVRQATIDKIQSLHSQYTRHNFNQLDPSTIIEYTSNELPSEKNNIDWEEVREILELYKANKYDLEKAEELLKLIFESPDN